MIDYKQKQSLADQVNKALDKLNVTGLKTYFHVGEIIIAGSILEGVSASSTCDNISRLLKYKVSSATLRFMVAFVKLYKGNTKKRLLQTAAPVTKVQELCHSQFEGRRDQIITSIFNGKREWSSIKTPGREAEAERQKAMRREDRKTDKDADHDISRDPNKIIIIPRINGNIDEDGIEDKLASLMTQTSVELVVKLVEKAKRRIK